MPLHAVSFILPSQKPKKGIICPIPVVLMVVGSEEFRDPSPYWNLGVLRGRFLTENSAGFLGVSIAELRIQLVLFGRVILDKFFELARVPLHPLNPRIQVEFDGVLEHRPELSKILPLGHEAGWARDGSRPVVLSRTAVPVGVSETSVTLPTDADGEVLREVLGECDDAGSLRITHPGG